MSTGPKQQTTHLSGSLQLCSLFSCLIVNLCTGSLCTQSQKNQEMVSISILLVSMLIFRYRDLHSPLSIFSPPPQCSIVVSENPFPLQTSFNGKSYSYSPFGCLFGPHRSTPLLRRHVKGSSGCQTLRDQGRLLTMKMEQRLFL